MRAETYEVVVYDGAVWFRGPVRYDDRAEAERAAASIKIAPACVKTTRELEAGRVSGASFPPCRR